MTELTERGKQIRRDTITLSKANGGYHWGGCFSVVEILIALFDFVMGDDGGMWRGDQLVLSKGHACWPYYVLLRERGFHPKLDGHPTRSLHDGIWCSTGSLGHGFPMAVGMAWAKKLAKEPGRVFVVMGDGECQEGTTWESMLIAVRLKLDNLVVIIDQNGLQGSGKILFDFNLWEVAQSLDWLDVSVDGHNVRSIVDMIAHLESIKLPDGKPTMLFAHTVKGKGVSFMENDPAWHAKWLGDEMEELAREELA